MKTIIALSSLVLFSGSCFADAFDLEIDLSKGINNNVYLESDDILASSGETAEQSEDIQTHTAIFAAYEFLDGKHSDASLIVDYFQETFDNNDLETQVSQYSLPVSYYHKNYRFRTTVSYTNYALSGDNILRYQGGKLDITRKLNNHRLGFISSLTNKTPADDRYIGYHGRSVDFGLYYQQLNIGSSIKLGTNIYNNNYDDQYLSNNGFYLNSSYSRYYIRHNWKLSARYKISQYTQDPLYSEIRRDKNYNLSYNHNVLIQRQMDMYFRSEYTINRSTIDEEEDNFNYSQWINSIGIRISI